MRASSFRRPIIRGTITTCPAGKSPPFSTEWPAAYAWRIRAGPAGRSRRPNRPHRGLVQPRRRFRVRIPAPPQARAARHERRTRLALPNPLRPARAGRRQPGPAGQFSIA